MQVIIDSDHKIGFHFTWEELPQLLEMVKGSIEKRKKPFLKIIDKIQNHPEWDESLKWSELEKIVRNEMEWPDDLIQSIEKQIETAKRVGYYSDSFIGVEQKESDKGWKDRFKEHADWMEIKIKI